MTLEQFITLFILQKNAREYSKKQYPVERGQEAKQIFAQAYNQLMANVAYESFDLLAPCLYPDQPNIPFVLFKPKIATTKNPAPMIIHTHGGPHVYMDKKEPHAEIAYFISQGFSIVCPNYRGSVAYPDFGNEEECAQWKEWEKKSKNKHHIYGPQDVYAVTKFVKGMPFVAKDKLYLRGGSFGSFINAHLLAEIKKGTYENLYQGVHLSGGINYPIPSAMAEDIPLLITHAKHDKVAPFENAYLFMEKMLLKQLSKELEGVEVNNLQTFVSETGGHHLIDITLTLEDKHSASYKELVTYLKHATSFFHELALGHKYQPVEAFDQYKQLRSYDNKKDNIEFELFTSLYAYQISSQLSLQNSAEESALQETKLLPKDAIGPTCSLLKLQLGDDYRGDIAIDLHNYLLHHFKPIDWNTSKKLHDAGSKILDNTDFVAQMIQIIEHEESFLQQHPNHMVMYHAAEPNTLQLYSFINVWQAIVLNKPIHKLPVISQMRMYEFMKNTFEDINVFLQKMRPYKATEKYFNYAPGFQERAISCNPSLISNAHSTAVSSLWLYFNVKEGQFTPTGKIIMDLLFMLGIYSPERVERYTELFARELKRGQSKPQALLQQLFVPYDIAHQKSYLCQIWGEEFKDNTIQLESPYNIKKMISDPFGFEQELRNNKEAYTNPDECLAFGDIENGFNYANYLQSRYLLGDHKDLFTFSYFRDDAAHNDFVSTLSQLIQEDYADFLASCTTLPNFIIKGAQSVKNTLVSKTKLGIFKPKDQVNLYAFELQQQELYRGLVQNPTKELYGDIVLLSKEDKEKIQDKLRQGCEEEVCYTLYTLSLCWDLKGYTYYDLLQEAIFATLDEEHALFVMEMVELFSTPSSIHNAEITEQHYFKLETLLQEHVVKYEYNASKHHFINLEKLKPCELWQAELGKAIGCFITHAKIATKRMNGFDIEADMDRVYCQDKDRACLIS